MHKPSRGKKRLVVAITLASAAAGAVIWVALAPEFESKFNNPLIPDSTQSTGAEAPMGGEKVASSTNTSTSTSRINTAETPTSDELSARIEQGEAPGSGEFTRADFFKPIDWGSDLVSLVAQEPQSMKFKPACKSHPRHSPDTSPAEWAETYTLTNATQRWPSSQTHVIDWNQFWQAKDVGYQVSIRWNFENPPRYSLVGYSFAVNKPDGYGTPAFPEKASLTWEEAKSFVLNWELEIVRSGGKPGTRTMSIAAKPFNPADVSPEDIERAEYANSKVRAAQTGKMSCNTLSTDLSELNCSCWF